jgi:cytosine permease
LGILVPPIGAIILVDQYIARRGSEIDVDWRAQAFLAWIAGSVMAFIVEKGMPEWCTALSAAIVGGAVYWGIMAMRPVAARHT